MRLRAWRDNGRPRGGRLLAQELVDARDRLVDRPLGTETVDHDALDGLRPDLLAIDHAVSPLAGDDLIAVVTWPGQELHGRGHPVRVARVEPERLLDQRRHRRHEAVPGEVEPVREPALADQETHELLGRRGVPAVPEDGGLDVVSLDGERLAA